MGAEILAKNEEKIFELLQDRESSVRKAALETISKMSPEILATKQDEIKPLLRDRVVSVRNKAHDIYDDIFLKTLKL